MNNIRRFAIGLVIACSAAIVAAETLPTVTFEPGWSQKSWSQGSPNGQNGWKSTGSDGPSCSGVPYDHMIVPKRTRFESFGEQSLRISNAVTSNCFHDQTYSAPVVNEAGEKMAYVDVRTGVRQRFFVFEFDVASTLPQSYQPGLAVGLSADKGDGGRMSWIEMADAADGLQVIFADYQDRSPYGSNTNPANGAEPGKDQFVYTTVASGLHRTAKHHVRVEHYFYDGPHNDVVIVNVDYGAFVHRGTSWEDYYRWVQPAVDPRQTALVRESRVVRSILFHTRTTRGTAPEFLGFGFAFDNVKQASGPIPSGPPPDKTECKHGRGHGRGGHDHHDGRHDRDDHHDGRHDRDDDHERDHDQHDGHDRHNDRDDDSDRHGSRHHRDRDGDGGRHFKAS